MNEMKQCSKCKEIKSADVFYKSKKLINKLPVLCNECILKIRTQSKADRLKNLEHCREYDRQKYQAHKKEWAIKHAAKRAKYLLDHKEELELRAIEKAKLKKEKRIIHNKKYYQDHSEIIKANVKVWNKENPTYQKDYSENNRESQSKRDKNKYQTDAHYRLKMMIHSSIYLSLKGNKHGRHWEDLVGYTLSDLIKHLESKFTPGMCWELYGSEIETDHIIPISSFNITSYDCDDFKKCWSLNNLQPLWETTRVIDGIKYIGNRNKRDKILTQAVI